MCNSLAKYHVCGNVLYQLHTQSLYQISVVIATGRDVVSSCRQTRPDKSFVPKNYMYYVYLTFK